jgi:crotonobetainyl-CoA:carnitine CoA-transferase CaiB-like acyl-CoA transferase
VELGLWVAGPAAGGIMADWGADVVKIEPPSGDPMRKLFGALSGSKEERCPPFDLHNRGKRSVAVDINSDEGGALTRRIVASADVVLTNMRPAFLQRVGLDHESLLGEHPRLVYASLTGYGLEGPDKDAPGYDVAAFSARSGVADRSRSPGESPPTLAGGKGDAITAITTVAGIMGALFDRERTGKGQLVATSLLRTGAYCIGMDLATRLDLDRLAPVRPRTAPQNVMLNSYVAGDGRWFWLMGAESTRHWPGLLLALDHPEIGEDERFQTPRDRRRNGEALVALLDELFATRSRSEWAERFAEHDVWWAPVNSVEDLLADEQAVAAGTFGNVSPGEGAPGHGKRYVATPVDFGSTPAGPTGPPPAIGSDTEAVLSDLGLGGDEVRRLRDEGVLGGRETAPVKQN